MDGQDGLAGAGEAALGVADALDYGVLVVGIVLAGPVVAAGAVGIDDVGGKEVGVVERVRIELGVGLGDGDGDIAGASGLVLGGGYGGNIVGDAGPDHILGHVSGAAVGEGDVGFDPFAGAVEAGTNGDGIGVGVW